MNFWANAPRFVCIAAFAVGSHASYAQVSSTDPQIVRDRIRSSVSIESVTKLDSPSLTNTRRLGSGVLVLKGGKTYGVTNSHVVHAAGPGERILVGLNLKSGKIYNIPMLVADDPINDVAILDWTDNYAGLHLPHSDSVQFDQIAVGISTFGDSLSFAPGVSVITIGYPLGLGSEIEQNLPVVRRGMIAQAPTSKNTFLIDGVASHGNSGSPVFSLDNGRLLGMVSGFPSDFIAAYDEAHRLVATLPYNSGLSVCVSASVIWKLIP